MHGILKTWVSGYTVPAYVGTGEGAMDQATVAYWLTWVGTGAWVICFWWMHRISARQDALLMELKELAKTQQDILKEVHPDVGEIKEHVVEEQGDKINTIAEQVTEVADVVTSSEPRKAPDNGQR
jgi:hypothetical protein